MVGIPHAIEKHIITVLKNNTAANTALDNRVYPSLPPTGTHAPYVILAQRSSNKVPAFDEVYRFVMQDVQRYNIKVVVKQGGYAEADRVFALIEAALAGSTAQVTTPGGITYHVAVAAMEDDIRFSTNDGERENFHVGGVFVIVVSPPVD